MGGRFAERHGQHAALAYAGEHGFGLAFGHQDGESAVVVRHTAADRARADRQAVMAAGTDIDRNAALDEGSVVGVDQGSGIVGHDPDHTVMTGRREPTACPSAELSLMAQWATKG